jgi:serine/threonine-protein kinase
MTRIVLHSLLILLVVILSLVRAQPQYDTTFITGFNYPLGVAVDNEGMLYVADTNDNHIVKLDSSGIPVSSFSTTSPGFYQPSGVAVDSRGNIYVADTNNNRIVNSSALMGLKSQCSIPAVRLW